VFEVNIVNVASQSAISIISEGQETRDCVFSDILFRQTNNRPS